MKRRQNGFTLVELIIVIAVIGVLAAILIPVFSNVIRKANAKSALADARNAVSQYVAESMEQRLQGISAPENIAIIVKKGGRFYLFGYDTAANSSILVSTANENGIEAANIDALIQSSSFNTQNGGTFDPDTTYTVADGYFYLVPYAGGVSQNTNVRGITTISGTDFLRLDREEAGQGFDLNVGNDTAVFHGCLVNGTYERTSTSSNDSTGSDDTTPPAQASYSVNFTTTGIDSADLANVVYKKGSQVLSNPATLTEGTGVGTLTAECPVATSAYSYTFTGATASNGHSTIDEADMTITFAFTKVMAQTYNVTYNANGGSGTMTDNTDYLTNGVVTLPENAFTAPGEHQHFTGWKINNTGELRQAGYQFNITADTEIYAQWGDDAQIAVHFNSNGGTGTMEDVSVYAGSYTLPECTFTKTHCHFNGWKANNTGATLGATYNVTEEVTFYATWEQDATYTITYNGNGATSGTAPVDSNSYYMNDTATLLGKGSLAYTHKHFTGWKVANGGALLSAGSSYTVTGSVTMFAQWENDDTYSVTYNGNGATGGTTPTDANSYYSGDSATLAANTFTYTHKHFTGWKANNTGSLLAVGSSYTVTGNVTMYAQWENDATYTVTYDANAGTDTVTGMPSADTGLYPGSHTLSSATPTRSGYSFRGWGATAGATSDISSVTITNSDVTVYAIWQQQAQGQQCTFTLSFYKNRIQESRLKGTTTYTASCPVGTYTFTMFELMDAGAWLDSGHDTKFQGIVPSSVSIPQESWDVEITSGVTEYSVDICVNEFAMSIEYLANDGLLTASTSSANCATGDYVEVQSNTFTNNGYDFTGWNTAPDGSGTSYAPGDSLRVCLSECQLFAQWSANGGQTDPRPHVVFRFADYDNRSTTLSGQQQNVVQPIYNVEPDKFIELTCEGIPGFLQDNGVGRIDLDVRYLHSYFDSQGFPNLARNSNTKYGLCRFDGTLFTDANGDYNPTSYTISGIETKTHIESQGNTIYIYLLVKQIP